MLRLSKIVYACIYMYMHVYAYTDAYSIFQWVGGNKNICYKKDRRLSRFKGDPFHIHWHPWGMAPQFEPALNQHCAVPICFVMEPVWKHGNVPIYRMEMRQSPTVAQFYAISTHAHPFEWPRHRFDCWLLLLKRAWSTLFLADVWPRDSRIHLRSSAVYNAV